MNHHIPDLPEDVQETIPPEPRLWLERYFPDGKFPRCLWSPSEKKLYFILANWTYQYRYFGKDPKHPKWIGYGINEDVMHIINPGHNYVASGELVLVEDIISASKVGHIIPTLCLFGSNISNKRLARIKQMGYDTILIWLDWDKRDYAIRAARNAQALGLNAQVIHTRRDPKEYDYGEIEWFINNELPLSSQKSVQV